LPDLVTPKTPQENKFLCDWCAKRIGQDEFRNATAVGYANHSGLIAVVVLHDLSPPNVFLSWAATTPRWMTRQTICMIYDWAYNQLGCSRITGLVERKNKRARKIDEGLGMKLEGVLRKASPSGQDLFVYGLLKNEADGLIKRLFNGKTKSAARS
jgi:RimJ/RimL family protein N-acetyltransferase